MRGVESDAKLLAVSDGEHAQVMLRIQRTEDTVSGQLTVESAPPADFYGWLELIDELERATSSAAANADAQEV